jgi:hypothetical protein
MAIYPTAEQIQRLLGGPPDRPVVMVNLLRFKARADAPDAGLSGEEAYRRYAELMMPFVESKGGRILWVGRVEIGAHRAAGLESQWLIAATGE